MRSHKLFGVNDTHSALNTTAVLRVLEPQTVEDVVRIVRRARSEGRPLAIAGGRHAMGGQQFLSGGLLLDMRRLNRTRAFDAQRGMLEVEAGIQWPGVIRAYLTRPGGMQLTVGDSAKADWGGSADDAEEQSLPTSMGAGSRRRPSSVISNRLRSLPRTGRSLRVAVSNGQSCSDTLSGATGSLAS